ncbi:MAG: hypothetical protein EZS28_030182, partial [Streblomastix strix]
MGVCASKPKALPEPEPEQQPEPEQNQQNEDDHQPEPTPEQQNYDDQQQQDQYQHEGGIDFPENQGSFNQQQQQEGSAGDDLWKSKRQDQEEDPNDRWKPSEAFDVPNAFNEDEDTNRDGAQLMGDKEPSFEKFGGNRLDMSSSSFRAPSYEEASASHAFEDTDTFMSSRSNKSAQSFLKLPAGDQHCVSEVGEWKVWKDPDEEKDKQDD